MTAQAKPTRPVGTGSLVHLGGDRWRIRYTAPKSFGARRQKSTTFTAKGSTAAEKEARRIVAQFERDQRARAAERGTVKDLVDDWLAVKSRTCSPTTMRQYELHAKAIVKKFGRMQAADLTARDIDRFYGDLIDAGTTPGTMRHVHGTLRAILRFGHRSRDLPVAATDRANPPKYNRPAIRPPSNELMREMLLGVRGQWGRAIFLAATTGMRRGEVVALQWRDLEGETLHVSRALIGLQGGGIAERPQTSGRAREIELSPAAVMVIETQRRQQAEECERFGRKPSPWIFPARRVDPTGKTPHPPGWLSLAWNKHRAKYDATNVRLHDLRHWFATNALESGVSVSDVSKLLGHARLSITTDIYGSDTRAGRRTAVDSVGKLLELPAS